MKKIAILLSLLVVGFGFAQEPELKSPEEKVNEQFGYVSFGVGPLPRLLPIFGVGYREQWDHHGFDTSLQAFTDIRVTAVKWNVLYEYYFKPSHSSQFYVGGGVGPKGFFGSAREVFAISPEFVFGKQYRNESQDLRFFQLQVSFPTFTIYHSTADVETFPATTLTYGIGF